MAYKIGIVGSEAAKFTPETEIAARCLIQNLIRDAHLVISGGCHLGGIDIWAKEEAAKLGIPMLEFLPEKLQWNGGYKERNEQIAAFSDEVYCITVKELPKTYTGMRFKFCYHCKTDEHVKSGGCWTTKYARSLGKVGKTLVIP